MPLYRDEAVVLRTHKLGEADRIITLLTRQHGRVRAVAKGVRRTTSRWGSRLEPFTHVDLQLAEGRSLDVITQAETLEPFNARLGLDYDRYTAGTVMLETAERLVTEEKEPAVQQFLLLVGGLRAMAGGEHAAKQVLDSYLLRSLSVAGYAPSFDHCVQCGVEGPHRFFNPSAGGVLCAVRQAARLRDPGRRDGAPAGRAARRRLAGRARRRPAPPARGQQPGRRPTSPGTSSAACAPWRTSSADRGGSGLLHRGHVRAEDAPVAVLVGDHGEPGGLGVVDDGPAGSHGGGDPLLDHLGRDVDLDVEPLSCRLVLAEPEVRHADRRVADLVAR